MTESEAKQHITETEIWRPIIFAVGLHIAGMYEVSNFGRVKSLDWIVESQGNFKLKPGKILKPKKNGRGYLYVWLCAPGKLYRQARVHRLVAAHFLPPSHGNNLQVNHKDFDKTNNITSNLEWTSQKGNIAHARAAGKYKGQIHPRKLDRKDAEGIRAARLNGMTCREISLQFRVSMHHVYSIIRGRSWK